MGSAGWALNGFGYAVAGYTTASAVQSACGLYNDASSAATAMATCGTIRGGVGGYSLNGFGYANNGSTAAAAPSFYNEVDCYRDAMNLWSVQSPAGTARALVANFTLNSFGYVCNGLAPTNLAGTVSAASTNEVDQFVMNPKIFPVLTTSLYVWDQ